MRHSFDSTGFDSVGPTKSSTTSLPFPVDSARNELRDIAGEAGRGDRGAMDEFRRAYVPQMRRIVCRVLRQEAPRGGATERAVRAEVQKVLHEHAGDRPLDRQELVELVVQRLSRAIVRRTRQGNTARLLNTVRA